MKSVAIVGLGWLGLPLALHLKELGWCVKGSKQSPDDAQKLHQLGIETYPFSLSDEMKRLPDHIRPLFNVDASKIEVLVQPTSIIHSMVEFEDGGVIAQMGIPHMKLPIQ